MTVYTRLKLEIAHSEWEDITGYYHPGISVEMLSIAKIGNFIVYISEIALKKNLDKIGHILVCCCTTEFY